jgi:hypothetical protein
MIIIDKALERREQEGNPIRVAMADGFYESKALPCRCSGLSWPVGRLVSRKCGR